MKQPKSFEEGAARLEEILAKMSDENTPLHEALKLYGEAANLVAYCHKTLQEAQLKIEEIDLQMDAYLSQEDTK